MLRSQIRVAPLTAVVLLTLTAVYPFISFLRMDAHEPAAPTDNGAKLKGLLEERLMTARELVKQVTQRVKSGQAIADELLEPTRLAHEAALELCASDNERIAVLEKFLADAQENERLSTNLSKSGQARHSTALNAKAERLRVEIELERAKAQKDAPQKGASKPEPDTTDNVVQPKKGDARRVSAQPATIQAIESARVFAQLSGWIKTQTVDIGDHVKRGQVLAVLDVADIEAQVKRANAVLNRANSRVRQMKARLVGAEADLETAKLAVKQAEQTVKSAAASVQYRAQRLRRMEELLKANAIDVKLVDESRADHEAAVATEQAAKLTVETTKAQAVVATTRIDGAKADLSTAEAGVILAQANLDQSQMHLAYGNIHAPFDGVITLRNYSRGEFVRSANTRINDAPLFTVERMDQLRVIVSLPERDVPFVDVGAIAELKIDALPGKKWSSKVSRIAAALDPKTRCMLIEIDLPNPTGQIRPGMSGIVTIDIEKGKE